MTESTLTSKGQTTVPQHIRAATGMQPGTRLMWHLMPDGTVLVRAKTGSVLDLAGSLHDSWVKKGRPKVSIEDMNPFK